MSYDFNDQLIEHDKEGYLIKLSDWNKELAILIAKHEDIEMSNDHWEVINFIRDYYHEFNISPAVRILTKAVKKKLGVEKGNSRYLYELFPYGPAKQASKIAGLPKPTNCI